MRYSLFLLVSLLWPYLCFANPSEADSLQDMIDKTRALRSLIQSDPHRPIYHFVAPEGHNAPFDPNGAIYWKGKYHLGYLYQRLVDGKKQNVWGHAVSTDLLNWTIYPDMIDVKEGDIEQSAISGGAFLSREGVPHIIYHGLGTAGNMLASSTDDDLKVWNKYEGNPVLTVPNPDKNDLSGKVCCMPPSKNEYTVFDPDAWYDKEADAYYQISGGIKPGLLKSDNMYDWEHLGEVVSEDKRMNYPFEDMSCPDFFSLGDKSMILFISHLLGAQYYIGTFVNDKFIPEQHGRMSWPGGTFFAPEQLQDDKGRNIIFAWVVQHSAIRPAHLRDYGWSGIMSLPRVISLADDGETLQINPAEEIKTIRLSELRESDIVLQPNTETTLTANGKSIELNVEISGGEQSPFGIKVFASPDGREETVIRYDPKQEELVIDFVKSSVSSSEYTMRALDADAAAAAYDPSNELGFHQPAFTENLNVVTEQRAPLKLKQGETLKLNVFLDRSIIEVFANGRQAVTQIVYPELDTSTAVKVFSGDEAITVKNIKSWDMAQTNAY